LRARRFAVLPAVICLSYAFAPALVCLAQPSRSVPDESVTVTAPKFVPDAVISNFVESYAAPSAALGKAARWADGVCPATDGLPRRWTNFINRRIRQVAAEVGAPVRAEDACKTNIEIVFTTAPQKLMDNVRAEHPQLLGYHYGPQEARLATFSHPVQAWYMTETEDLRGARSVDTTTPRTAGMQMEFIDLDGVPVYMPEARLQSVKQSRLGDGLRSDLYHVLIVADPGQLRDFEMGALADYIAMLALAQAGSDDACLPAASIANLLSADCAADMKPDAISDFDLAYLRGLYGMDAASNLVIQRGAIAHQMKQSLQGR
jgi:hypothetical protein